MKPLSDYRLLFFGGKGGVGKTTVSLAYAIAQAEQGKKVLHMSASRQGVVAQLFGRRKGVGYDEVKLESNLYAMDLDPRGALHEYVLRQVKLEMVYRFVFENKVMRAFVDVTPGLDDLLCFGKVIDALDLLEKKKKSQHYDCVLVDLPATGHGMNMLRIPKTVITMIPAGPLNRHAHKMLEVLQNKDLTALCAVTLPEEMPVNETLEMVAGFRKDLDVEARAIFANGIYPELFSENELAAVVSEAPTPLSSTIRCARSQVRRRHMHVENLARLRNEASSIPLAELPFLFVPKFDRAALGALAQRMKGL